MKIEGKIMRAREWMLVDVEKIEGEAPEDKTEVCGATLHYDEQDSRMWIADNCLYLPKSERCPCLIVGFAGRAAAEFATDILRALRTLNANGMPPQEVKCLECGRPGVVVWRRRKPEHGVVCQNVDCGCGTDWHETVKEAWAQWTEMNATAYMPGTIPEFEWVAI